MNDNHNPFNIINPASTKVYKETASDAPTQERIKKMIIIFIIII